MACRQVKQDLFWPPSYCRKIPKREKQMSVEDDCHLKMVVSNPGRLLLLIERLVDKSSAALEAKINSYLMHEAECECVFLINLSPQTEESIVKTVGKEILTTPLRNHLPKKNIKNLIHYKNKALRCNEELNPQLISVVQEIVTDRNPAPLETIIVPIITNISKSFVCSHKDIEPVLLVCFVGSPKDDFYLITLASELFKFCLTLLRNTYAAEEEDRQKRQCQALLAVARRFLSHLHDVNDLLTEIMTEARNLTNADRCSLFLLDPEHMQLVAKVFDGVSPNKSVAPELWIAKDKGIAGHVATSGKILNIHNAYEHPLFFKGMDEVTGFKTRNILCFPIRDEKGIIGVAQLCNKKDGNFTYFDEEVASAFSIYCGLSIMHSLVYKEVQDAQARNKLSNEMMMYHIKINDDEVKIKLTCKLPHDPPDLATFAFSPRKVPFQETVCFIIQMFDELGFIAYFGLKRDVLVRFVLFVQKGYRDPPYHNWLHAFSVTHHLFVCIKSFRLIENQLITMLEAMALVVSGLCHDIDHRGTNNSFQMQSNSALASLYSSQGSVMERHHLAQALCRLNAEGCNFLEPLKCGDYTLCLDLIQDMILATDLATHFKVYDQQLEMAVNGYDKENPIHRYNFVCLMMTCADLSDQTKDWLIVKKVAKNVYEEFFCQGDLEVEMGKEPLPMMNRAKADIPQLQIEFLNEVCLPAYKILKLLFPESRELVREIKKNVLCWECSKCYFQQAAEDGLLPMDVLESPELEEKVQEVLKSLDLSKKLSEEQFTNE